jgi:putrescine transport system substrate-binding protein
MLIAGLATLAQARGELKIYNWSDYINPAVLDAFTRETGIRIIYDTYDRADEAVAGLKGAGYDLVLISAAQVSQQLPRKVLAPLDKTRLANLSHMSPEVMKGLARHDPGNRHAVNYAWGTTGLGYNVRRIRERLGPEARIDSWSVLFNPETLKKLAPCGVHVLDSPEELFPAALRYLGIDPDSKREADWRRAADLLMKIRPYVQKFSSTELVGALANGDICLAVGPSGDVQQARRRAAEAKGSTEIGYVIPREGALIWLDNLVIPADSPNPEAAHRFLEFINRPEIAALNAGFLHSASPNLAALRHLPASLATDRGIYPTAETLARLYTVTAPDEASRRTLNRLWLRVKSGK